MALISRTSFLTSHHFLPASGLLLNCYGTGPYVEDRKTESVAFKYHPTDNTNISHSRNNVVVSSQTNKKQIVRRHGTTSTTPTTSRFLNETERNLDFCFKKVRQYEFENFLCTLLLPEAARRSAFAIRAFNIEIAQVRDSIKDRTIGEMRMQFWRDAVDAMYDSSKKVPKGNPVIAELENAVESHQLTKSWLLRIIESRQEHLAEKPHPTLDSLEKYAESTVASVNYLLLETLNTRDVRVDHAASHLGKAQGIATTIRATPFHAQKRRVVLPLDILMKHGASSEDFIQGKRTEAVKEVTFDLASQAHAHLNAARGMIDHVPKEVRPVFLTSVATHDFLSRLRKVHFDPFHPKMLERNQLLPMRLWWKHFRTSY